MAQDPWAAFPDAPGQSAAPVAKGDEWDAFPDAPRTRKPPKLRSAINKETRPQLDGTAVDGDTLRAVAGPNLRLYGADAPERDQQGWNRQGEPVPIGSQATNALDALVSPTAMVGPINNISYGRPVAPVQQDGRDVGQVTIRAGNALAAPDDLTDDPERRFEYMQAERLARLNRLGVHAVVAQTPQEHRANPDYVPDRETIARFWDTPTPLAGMRPEVERQVLAMQNDPAVPPERIVAFARENGFVVDPADIVKSRAAAAKIGTTIGIGYARAPTPLTDLGDGATGAVVRGVADGVLPNMLDEAGAVVDTFGGTSGRENVWNSDRRLADIVANNWRQNEAIIGHDELAHPYARLTGEIAGGLVVPFGAAAKTVPQLARVGGAYGAVAGFGGGDTLPDRLTQGVVGAGAGAVVGAAGGKALEYGLPKLKDGWRWVRGKNGPEAVPEAAVGAPEGVSPAPGPDGAPEAPAGASDRVPDRLDIGSDSARAPDPRKLRSAIDRGEAPAAQAMSAGDGPVLRSAIRQPDYLDMGSSPRPLLRDRTEAELRAAGERIEPRDVLPIRSNEVGSIEEAAGIDAGRIVEAKAPNERTMLERRTVRNVMGLPVPKVGPTDLVGWLRLQGGLKDQGGELSHMGLNNAARRMDFAGQEHRFGPLVSDTGVDFDTAAHAAWEAGYFPDLSERPDVNTFLDALRDTYEGRQRRFLPEDHGEVERFYGAQADRFDLERRMAEEGPVYADRSMPADEPQPFPPVQAYEDWPDGGPDFAGNIRLEKLESPQDIKRALSVTEQRVGFDAATRGRVAQAETERLASELGMTPDALLSRRKGQAFNAEEALAARQILAKSGNELVNAAKRVQTMDEPGDDVLAEFRRAWMRHAAIQEQVAGMTAEAGRALAQFKMLANSRAVKGDVLTALLGAGGGRDRVRQAAETLLEAAEVMPDRFHVVAKKIAKPRFRDKLIEVYINYLLSGPQTHVVNVTSNTLTAIAQIPEHMAAAVIGKARQAMSRASVDRVIASEVGARTFGLLQGAKEGARLFAKTLRTGIPSDMVAQVESQQFRAISGIKGEVIRVPSRFLMAEDELFKGVARRMELSGLAVRQAHKEGLKGQAATARIAELVANPTDDMLARSLDYARYLTFQRKLGPGAGKVAGLTQDWPVLKPFLPFVRTPTNLLKFAVERSPAAPILREWRADFKAGGARRDLAVARVMLGTGFGALVYHYAQQGVISGTAPTDPSKARLMYADGWQPYSIRVGDTWYSYKRLDPFSTTIGTAADLALLPEGMSERQRDDKVTLLIASIMGNLASKTWLSGISDVVGALHEPDRNTDRLIQRFVGAATVPAGVAQIARAVDPVQRETESVGEYVRSRIPGLSDDLLPKRDVWGEPVESEGGLGPDILSPIWESTAKNDPVNRAMLDAGASISAPRDRIGSRQLTPQEYDRYKALAGQGAHRAVQALVRSPEWRTLDQEGREKAAERAITAARREARAELFGGGKTEAAGDEWDVFPDAKGGKSAPPASADDEWSAFPDVPQPDVVGSLERAIPGVRFTSGFRTPEYQASMRRRGYRPATNSAHLDGSSLDMLPPPGKSLGWLRGQVARVHPDAALSIHDGHLHATFPGWYGAPVLGGAKVAGLNNPMASR